MANKLTGFGFLLAGALVGGTAAMLAAPMSGRRARRLVRRKAERARREAVVGAKRIRQNAEQLYARSGEFLHDMERRASEGLNALGR